MTCAQIAIMPKNNANEASAAASSTRARTMITTPHRQEQDMNIVHAMFAVKWEFSMAPSRPDPTSAGMTKWVLRLYCRAIFFIGFVAIVPAGARGVSATGEYKSVL